MRALITGAGGTIGSRLCEHLRQRGDEPLAWPRERVPLDDYAAMERFVRETAPDVLFHLATASQPTGRPGESWLVNYEWTSELAWIARTLGVRFVFSSTTLVFSNKARGPFSVHSAPDATEGYGYEKRRAEERVFHQNPEARVARLGWQIDTARLTGNNMVAWLEERMRREGRIEASTRWLPACAFIEDTVQGLCALAEGPPGLYQLDSNERWSHYDIARALDALLGGRWRVEPSEHFVYDQRLLEERVRLPSLAARLPGLP